MNPDAAALPLRDIHAAAPLAWWPPAPGWWVLALLLALLLVWVSRQLWLRGRAWRLKRALKAEFSNILTACRSSRDGCLMLAESATFLRRLLVHIGGRKARAGVVGEAWAEYLSSLFPGDMKMRRVCSDLASGAYRPAGATPYPNPALLSDLAARWIDCCVLDSQSRD